jgi:hypothetical protein
VRKQALLFLKKRGNYILEATQAKYGLKEYFPCTQPYTMLA